MRGLILALLAYGLWGGFPLYFSVLAHVPSFEVLANRVVWAFLVTLAVIVLMGRQQQLKQVLLDKRALGWLSLSSILIAINWLVFIWAVSQHRVLESSLGYFMTPLVSMVLGRLILNESINRLQAIAALLAAIAVLLELVTLGKLPWVSLVLALSFGIYGLVRKQQPVDNLTGLMVETLLILPAALLYLYWYRDNLSFGTDVITTGFLLASGIVTAIPLLLFAAATRYLDLTVVGFIMYINPTLQFITAVFVFNEAYTVQRIITFGLIWIGMFFFMGGLWQISAAKKRRYSVKNVTE